LNDKRSKCIVEFVMLNKFINTIEFSAYMYNIVAVGVGDYYRKWLAPSLQIMHDLGLVELIATIDIKEREIYDGHPFDHVQHRIRDEDARLSSLINDLRGRKPIVILGHSNDLHTSDAVDLASNGFKVMVEKPYVIDEQQFSAMEDLVRGDQDVVLLESFLVKNSLPLLVLGGLIRKDTFYFEGAQTFRSHYSSETPSDLSGRIQEMIGEPRSISVEFLEGKGKAGRLDHRGSHLIDTRKGGGIIQDVGLHAVSPIIAFEEYLGSIDPTFSDGSVQIGRCDEYLRMTTERFDLDPEFIAETYAEMYLSTSKGISIKIAIGKYVGNENQRRIIITGNKGTLCHDLTNHLLYVGREEDKQPVLEYPTDFMYCPVLRTGLELIHGRNPFTFDPTDVALRAQRFVLNVLKKVDYVSSGITVYTSGINPREIFKNK